MGDNSGERYINEPVPWHEGSDLADAGQSGCTELRQPERERVSRRTRKSLVGSAEQRQNSFHASEINGDYVPKRLWLTWPVQWFSIGFIGGKRSRTSNKIMRACIPFRNGSVRFASLRISMWESSASVSPAVWVEFVGSAKIAPLGYVVSMILIGLPQVVLW